MEIMATSKNYGKKGSDHFRDILNPYGEKSNYGKIGRRRRLSKLNVLFFSIILSVTIYIYIYILTLSGLPWFTKSGTPRRHDRIMAVDGSTGNLQNALGDALQRYLAPGVIGG